MLFENLGIRVLDCVKSHSDAEDGSHRIGREGVLYLGDIGEHSAMEFKDGEKTKWSRTTKIEKIGLYDNIIQVTTRNHVYTFERL